MNYYEHHLGDYLRDTAHLSMVEDGAYRRLLDAYYIRETPLPLASRELHRLVRAAAKQDRQAVDVVLREFFIETAGGWVHRRCDREIARFQDKQRKAKASADARWSHIERNANASPNAMRTHSERNADGMHRAPVPSPQSPVTSHQTPGKTEEMPPIPETSGNPEVPPPPAAAKASASQRGTRLAAGWQLPKPWGDWALATQPGWTAETVRLEAAKFGDHWLAKAGKDAAKADWQATWRNWCRNVRPGLANGRGAPSAPPIDTATRDAEARRLLGFAPAVPARETLDA